MSFGEPDRKRPQIFLVVEKVAGQAAPCGLALRFAGGGGDRGGRRLGKIRRQWSWSGRGRLASRIGGSETRCIGKVGPYLSLLLRRIGKRGKEPSGAIESKKRATSESHAEGLDAGWMAGVWRRTVRNRSHLNGGA